MRRGSEAEELLGDLGVTGGQDLLLVEATGATGRLALQVVAEVRLLLHASDAGEDGRKKLAQAWRVGEGDEGSGREGMILPVDRGTLSMALGRENAVHLALTDARAADRVLAHLSRWQFFTGWSRDAANRDSDPHAASVSGEEKIGALPTSDAASDAF